MTKDEREFAHAAIEQMLAAINHISRALTLDKEEYPNAIYNYVTKGRLAMQNAVDWMDRIKKQ
jgi:hypothetical protein